MDAIPQRRRLAKKLTAWALGFEERRRFAHLVSRHRFALEEQQAAIDWIFLRAELLTRQQHPEVASKPREDWGRGPEQSFQAWSRALYGQVADDLVELGTDLAERQEAVSQYAARLGFRRHADLVDALGLDVPAERRAANER